jgi:hypothetical protein
LEGKKVTANIGQIHGMMLEEALLYLLEVTGYRVVESAMMNGKHDPTLRDGHAGLEILGRGSVHPIDAVMDFAIAQPFSTPQRLLIEAKFKTQKTGIEAVRNAVGIVKDISEYWGAKDQIPPKPRYQYRYAIFSTSAYTNPAQKYAYAHDIGLIPLERSPFLQPILKSIQTLVINHFYTPLNDKTFGQLRRAIRERIRDSKSLAFRELVLPKYVPLVEEFCRECRWLNGVLIGCIARQFPILLVPHPDVRIDELKTQFKVEIHWDQEGFYLRQVNSDRNLFSFDLPEELFKIYAEQGLLCEMHKLDSKSDLSEIQAMVMYDSQARAITFQFEPDWIEKYFEKVSINLAEETDDKSER